MALCECKPKAPLRPPVPPPLTPAEAWEAARTAAQRAVQRAPKAWARVNAAFRTNAIELFNARTAALTNPEKRTAATLVSTLARSAMALEQLLTGAATESPAHARWRTEIAAVARRVAAVDGKSAAETEPARLRERITTIMRSPEQYPMAQQVMVAALAVPEEPGLDRAFRNQLEAARLFFAS